LTGNVYHQSVKKMKDQLIKKFIWK